MLVDDQGNACISDFGLSMIMQTIEATSFTSTTTWTRGSARWMAPELLYPEKLGLTSFMPTSSSDVYALACFILEVFLNTVNLKVVHVPNKNWFAGHDRRGPFSSNHQRRHCYFKVAQWGSAWQTSITWVCRTWSYWCTLGPHREMLGRGA